MEFQKIKVTKQNTLDVTYKDADGNIVQGDGSLDTAPEYHHGAA